MNELLTLVLAQAEDVFALRQCGRVAMSAIGCDEADQVRFATALSEIGREVVAAKAKSSATFFIEDDALAVRIGGVPVAAKGRPSDGLLAAQRLVQAIEVEREADGKSETVTLRRGFANRAQPGALRALLRRSSTLTPLEELRIQNNDLLNALESVQAQREELVELNAELEHTNRGVLAMYAELEGELEETNRGVVALYAELDDKTLRLNDVSEAKTRFLANVSHELRGPINAILGLLRLTLESDGDDGAERQRQVSLAIGAANDLLALVNGLLDLSKAESGRLEPDIADTDLRDVFGELRGTLRPLAKPGVELVVEQPAVWNIETDRILLAQVLRNLITNALKFTESGTVTVTASEKSPLELEIAVRDTGVGIAPEDLARIFEEFYQVRGPLQTKQKGTGLGLPYARLASRALGGDLSVESTPGAGSAFYVRLPMRWVAPVNAAATPGRSEVAPHSLGTVLVVDDDARFREIVRGLLQGFAAEILEADNGVHALQIMRAHTPDLVFLDLRMPSMDGDDVMSQMKLEPVLRDVPVVMVSSAELDVASRPILGSAAALLAKSNVSKQTLQEAIAKAGVR
ncbi:MAG TPA: ATP-binding protein [Candidatus Baltobacteraceae bacterium]